MPLTNFQKYRWQGVWDGGQPDPIVDVWYGFSDAIMPYLVPRDDLIIYGLEVMQENTGAAVEDIEISVEIDDQPAVLATLAILPSGEWHGLVLDLEGQALVDSGADVVNGFLQFTIHNLPLHCGKFEFEIRQISPVGAGAVLNWILWHSKKGLT